MTQKHGYTPIVRVARFMPGGSELASPEDPVDARVASGETNVEDKNTVRYPTHPGMYASDV
jgi:hypothetical protein